MTYGFGWNTIAQNLQLGLNPINFVPGYGMPYANPHFATPQFAAPWNNCVGTCGVNGWLPQNTVAGLPYGSWTNTWPSQYGAQYSGQYPTQYPTQNPAQYAPQYPTAWTNGFNTPNALPFNYTQVHSTQQAPITQGYGTQVPTTQFANTYQPWQQQISQLLPQYGLGTTFPGANSYSVPYILPSNTTIPYNTFSNASPIQFQGFQPSNNQVAQAFTPPPPLPQANFQPNFQPNNQTGFAWGTQVNNGLAYPQFFANTNALGIFGTSHFQPQYGQNYGQQSGQLFGQPVNNPLANPLAQCWTNLLPTTQNPLTTPIPFASVPGVNIPNYFVPGYPTNYTPTNFAPTNFAPTNFAPNGYSPTGYTPINYVPGTYPFANVMPGQVSNMVPGYIPGLIPGVVPGTIPTGINGQPFQGNPLENVEPNGQQIGNQKRPLSRTGA